MHIFSNIQLKRVEDHCWREKWQKILVKDIGMGPLKNGVRP